MNVRKTIALGACLLTSSCALSAQNFIQDGQLTGYRADKGKIDVWVSHKKSSKGLGDVGTSKDTAFGPEGSAHIRFKSDVGTHDFTEKPGLSQVVTGLSTNTDMSYSSYYCDKKGPNSQTQLYFGVKPVADKSLTGDVIKEQRAHVSDLSSAPQGKRKCFRQVTFDFNTGDNTEVEVFSLLEVDTAITPNLVTSSELEVRVDEFTLTEKI